MPDMTTVSHARLSGRFIGTRYNLRRKELHRKNIYRFYRYNVRSS